MQGITILDTRNQSNDVVLTEEQARAKLEEMKKKAQECFVKEAVNGKLGFKAVRDVAVLLNVGLDNKDVAFLIKETTGQEISEIDEEQFMGMFVTSYNPSVLFNSYNAIRQGKVFLHSSNLDDALAGIGIYGFTQLRASELRRFFSRDNLYSQRDEVTFELFCRITTPVCQLLAKERIPEDKLVSSSEILNYVHSIFGAMVLALLSLIPKPSTPMLDLSQTGDTTLTTTNTAHRLAYPLVYDPLKQVSYMYLMDILTVVFACSWGGFYLLYLKRKHKYRGKLFSQLSLLAAILLIGILLASLNPVLIIFFILCLIGFGLPIFNLDKK